MELIRVLIRLPLVLLYMLSGFIAIILLHILAGRQWYQRAFGRTVIERWMHIFAWLAGMRVQVHGTPTVGLLAANHVSWLDIVAIDTAIASRFVSKDDVLRWPIIGLLPKWSGTFFLQRGSAVAVGRLNEEIVEALKQGATVAVFPEGTTHDGCEVHRFYSALLQNGIDAGVPVQGVGIRYVRDGKLDTVAPFINNDGFMEHTLRILKAPFIEVHLYFCEPFIPHDLDRKQLASHLQQQVTDILAENRLD